MPRKGALTGALLGIAAMFVLQALIATLWRSHVDRSARQLAEHSMASMADVARIRDDVEREHALVEEHILNRRPANMAGLEAKIQAVRDDLDATSRAYSPLMDSPEEAITWHFTQQRLARIHQFLGQVLALSRENLNATAEAKLEELERDYAAFDSAIGELIAINRNDVRGVLAQGASLEMRGRGVVLATEIVGLIGLLLVGLWGFKRVANEQRQLARVQVLEERNRELDAFSGRVAHDLRNPLGTIALTTAQLAAQVDDARAIERLQRGSRRIQDLINDLLALSRATGERNGATCDPSVIAAKLEDDFCDRFGHDAELHHDVETATVPYSESLLGQAVWNLVENAVKYHREGVRPQVDLSGRRAGDHYELAVTDHGRGMSEHEVARVFEPFYRAGDVRAVAGTGLGLAIVKRVVEARGGVVSLSSRPGEGSTFVLSLPITGVEQREAR
jgi:signal transduction histidine kinase